MVLVFLDMFKKFFSSLTDMTIFFIATVSWKLIWIVQPIFKAAEF